MDLGYGRFTRETQSIRNSLVYLDTLAINSRYGDHVRVSKAFTLVWMASAMEAFWKDFLWQLCTRVSLAPAQKRRKNISTAAIYYFDVMGSMGEGKKLRRWAKTAEFFEGLSAANHSPPVIPYDGRTIRPEHIALAWRIFSLKGPDFPSHMHKQDLNSLADQRNDVAHGLTDPRTMGGTMTVNDLHKRLDRLDEIALHCVIAANSKWPNS